MNTLVEPPVARAKKSDRFEMLVEPKWLKRVEKQAERFGMTVSAYVRLAVTEKLERDEGGPASPLLEGIRQDEQFRREAADRKKH